MHNSNLKKNFCIKNLNNISDSIHPLLNYKFSLDPDKHECFVLPQLIDNKIITHKQLDKNTDVIIDTETDNINKTKNEDDEKYNIITNFSLPINSNNFIEIIYNITTLSQLEDWFNNYDPNNIKIAEIILNLFWFTKIQEIIEDIDLFIKINITIISTVFNKTIDYNKCQKIINHLIKHSYGKKINYLHKIKKYLTK